jgi:hypothetical protein
VAGVKISFSATGYPDSYAYADNEPVLSCDGYAEDGFFSILVPRDVQGTLTFEGPNSVSKTALTTFPPTPADLEVQIPFELRENVFVFADLPNYHQISVHATDRLTDEDVVGARLSASLISGESFGCAASVGFYYPLITSVDEAEDVTFGAPVCSYNPASANSEALTTDRLGAATLYVLDSEMQNSISQLQVTVSEPGGGPRFGQALVSTSQPSTLEISLLSVPDAPAAPVLTTGPAQLSVGLAAPSDNGGLEVSSYSVFTSGTVDGVFNAVASGTCSGLVSASLSSCTITNLPAGIERFVKVAANNAIGNSVASQASSGTPEEVPVVVAPPSGGGGGGGGFFPAPVIPAEPIVSNPFTATTKLTVLDSGGNAIDLNSSVSVDKKSISLEFGAAKLSLSSVAAVSFSDSGRLTAATGSSVTFAATGYQPDSLISGYLVPVANLTTASFRFFSSAPISLGTATVDQDGRFNFAANLGSVPGIYALQLSGTAIGGQKADLMLETQIGATSSSASRTWAKRMVSNTQAKLYAKNIIGSGKVSFRVNGKEIAWVNAASTADRKLRLVGNDNYLVRTINLVKGKNVLEVFVDGKRTTRTVYSRN